MNKIRDLMLRPWSCQDGAESSLLQGKNIYIPGSTNIDIENASFEDVSSQLKLVIFHCHISVLEGIRCIRWSWFSYGSKFVEPYMKMDYCPPETNHKPWTIDGWKTAFLMGFGYLFPATNSLLVLVQKNASKIVPWLFMTNLFGGGGCIMLYPLGSMYGIFTYIKIKNINMNPMGIQANSLCFVVFSRGDVVDICVVISVHF